MRKAKKSHICLKTELGPPVTEVKSKRNISLYLATRGKIGLSPSSSNNNQKTALPGFGWEFKHYQDKVTFYIKFCLNNDYKSQKPAEIVAFLRFSLGGWAPSYLVFTRAKCKSVFLQVSKRVHVARTIVLSRQILDPICGRLPRK